MRQQLQQQHSLDLGLVILNVNNLKKLHHFYEDIIGLSTLEEKSGTVTLGIKETNLPLVQLHQLHPSAPKKQQTGLYHLAFLLPSRVALGGILRHLIMTKSPLIGAADHGYSEAIYLEDPEGNGIEIYTDKETSHWDVRDNGDIKGISIEMDARSMLEEAPLPLAKMPAGTMMGHIHLSVSDLSANDSFYQDILGLQLTDNLGGSARFYAKDGYHHHIAANIWQGRGLAKRETDDLGIHSYEMIWTEEGSFNKIQEQLLMNKFPVKPLTDTQFTTIDPNGITIHMILK